jgi:hypothetical protein
VSLTWCRSNIQREAALRRLETAAEALNQLFAPLHQFKQHNGSRVTLPTSHAPPSTQAFPLRYETTTTIRRLPSLPINSLDETADAIDEESPISDRTSPRNDSPVAVHSHSHSHEHAGGLNQTTPTQTTPTSTALSYPASPAYSEAPSSYASTQSSVMSPATPVTSVSDIPRSFFPHTDEERKAVDRGNGIASHHHALSASSPTQLRTLEPPITSQPLHTRSGVTSPEHYGLPPTSRGCT